MHRAQFFNRSLLAQCPSGFPFVRFLVLQPLFLHIHSWQEGQHVVLLQIRATLSLVRMSDIFSCIEKSVADFGIQDYARGVHISAPSEMVVNKKKSFVSRSKPCRFTFLGVVSIDGPTKTFPSRHFLGTLIFDQSPCRKQSKLACTIIGLFLLGLLLNPGKEVSG